MRIAPGGFAVAALPGAVAGIAAVLSLWPLVAIGATLAVAVLVFYRDPSRTPAGAGVLAPADGRIKEIEVGDGHLEVAIFLNIHNVHVVRAPAAGEVQETEQVSGHRRPSFLPSAGGNAGIEVTADEWNSTMRAGLIARRVRSYVSVGDSIERGERIGHIAFGSRVDITVPIETSPDELNVRVGDRVQAGETVLVSR